MGPMHSVSFGHSVTPRGSTATSSPPSRRRPQKPRGGLSRFAGGGKIGALGSLRYLEPERGTTRGLRPEDFRGGTTLENDPRNNPYVSTALSEHDRLMSALGAPPPGVERDMTPAWKNTFTQKVIDNVHGPAPWQEVLEFLLGDSPATGALMADQFTHKGMMPSPTGAGLAALLRSGDAAAPPLREPDYKSYGKWQPFKRYD